MVPLVDESLVMSAWPHLAPMPDRPVHPGDAPTCSVIIAAYNVAPFLGDALSSAFAQTAPPLEVIVCDDGSTDGIEGALEPYRDRICLISQPHSGEGAARNAAVRAASGELIVVLDGDDIFHPRRLE